MKRLSTVSVIDDDKLFQFIITKLLESTKIIDAILPFPNGREALDYFLENKHHPELLPDLVFLDLDMPVMNGWEFLDQFSGNSFGKERITIYICTSSVNPRDMELYKHYATVSGYKIKPITKEELYLLLEKEISLQ
ncbi:response regulator [Pedobacter sp. SYSU D00535]|uniref:response regulator n=1 Tax=Pedobacter sp. SYSU D00535 TaxID=2810308 RepID=UPI001A96C218|nr:response regulator [Pedobacter sp. SYSU D00535]